MSYTPTNWVSGSTPLSAENMNHIEQGIADLNSKLNPFLITRTVTATITRSNGSRSSITAPSVNGYTFLCWISAVSNGWIGNVYIENPTAITSNIWSANYGYSDSTNGTVYACALYVHN